MTLETWIAYVFASAAILIVPGPTVVMVVTQAAAHGRKAAPWLSAGVVLGDFTAMTLSLIGLGAVMAASATLFSCLKYVGAAYLLWLGVRIWRSSPSADEGEEDIASRPRNAALFRRAFLVTVLNPKAIAFFVAFLPQFVDPTRPTLSQLLILGGTFLFLSAVNSSSYGLFAGRFSGVLRSRKAKKRLHRIGGGALVGAGIFTAASS